MHNEAAGTGKTRERRQGVGRCSLCSFVVAGRGKEGESNSGASDARTDHHAGATYQGPPRPTRPPSRDHLSGTTCQGPPSRDHQAGTTQQGPSTPTRPQRRDHLAGPDWNARSSPPRVGGMEHGLFVRPLLRELFRHPA
eukprot:354230-Chlamydomonas_euryale.AAC.9